MISPQVEGKELVTGMRLTLDEFLSRWEAIPELKKAELIDGVVYVPSPVGIDHGNLDTTIHWWLKQYKAATPGCRPANNATLKMLGQSPQPDALLRILESHGGQSSGKGKFFEGAPELAVEICVSSTEVDFGPKRNLYQRAGVQEYITIESFQPRIVWRALVNGKYQMIEPDAGGIFRSRCFPGLWLDSDALYADDEVRMMLALNAGLATPEHAQFVEELARRAAALKT